MFSNGLHVKRFLIPVHVVRLHTHRPIVNVNVGNRPTLLLKRKLNSSGTFARCLVCQQSGHGITNGCASVRLGQVSLLKTTAIPLALKTLSASVLSTRRWFTVSSSVLERLKPEVLKKRVDNLTDCFAEARELLGDARESIGSTYFSDDMMEAQEAVSSTIGKYKALLADLDEDQRNDVVRTIGLRMEELKAQEQAIKDLLD